MKSYKPTPEDLRDHRVTDIWSALNDYKVASALLRFLVDNHQLPEDFEVQKEARLFALAATSRENRSTLDKIISEDGEL